MSRYTGKKIFIVLICGLFIVIGAVFSAAALLGHRGVDGFMLMMGLPFLFFGVFGLRGGLKQIAKFQNITYAWYKQQHPNCVSGNKVSCHACGCERIQVRSLMNHTYHRAHFCTQCGETLYYSPEK